MSMGQSAVPDIDRDKLLEACGSVYGPAVFDDVMTVVKEAASLPIEWRTMSLTDGIDDIMARFSVMHPETHTRGSFSGRTVCWVAMVVTVLRADLDAAGREPAWVIRGPVLATVGVRGSERGGLGYS